MGTVDVEQVNLRMRGFDRLYGLQLLACSDTEVRARIVVRDELKQPAGLIHGGVYASIAESMASLATALAVYEQGDTAMGLSNNTSFLRPITEGSVHAAATRVHRGRTTWVWDVRFSDDADRTCALTRMTIAVRSHADRAAAKVPAPAAVLRRSRCLAALPAAALRARPAR
jgi:1,4-dihydroxy-2-naphthoyl-CoA hydrolase